MSAPLKIEMKQSEIEIYKACETKILQVTVNKLSVYTPEEREVMLLKMVSSEMAFIQLYGLNGKFQKIRKAVDNAN